MFRTLAALLLLATPAAAETLEAHVHGHARLTLAVDGDTVTVEVESPAESIVGFETEPKTDEERAAMRDAEAALLRPETLFTFPEAAGCAAADKRVEVEREGEHAEFHATYTFRCADISAVTSMDTALMERFETMEEIDVEFATPAGQGAAELERGETRVSLTN